MERPDEREADEGERASGTEGSERGCDVKVLKTLAGLVVVMVLGVASFPWILWSIGRMACGDDEGAERAVDASPMVLWLDFVESRRAD